MVKLAGLGRSSIIFLFIILVWIVSVELELVSKIFLPSPLDVVMAVIRGLQDGSLLSDIAVSLSRILSGFVISFCIALPLGTIVGTAPRFRGYFQPFNDFLRYIPVPAMLPLIILWLGIGNSAQIAVIVFGTLPQLLVLIADAVSRMPAVYKELCKVVHLTRTQTIMHAVVPFAGPQIYDAARVTIGWAWSYLLVAEIVGANMGLGQRIIIGQRFLRTDQVMAGILTVAILGFLTDLLLRLLYPVLFPWTESDERT